MCRTTTKSIIAVKVPKLNADKRAPPVYMTIGRLRIGSHAICATSSLIVTITALLRPDWQPIVMLSVALNSLTAWDAMNLLPQVPLRTEIVPGVVAPHKEAFKRTMSMMHYANLRILQKLYTQQFEMSATALGLYYAFCWAFGWYYFAPFNSDSRNGNTWIFVVPMFVAVITDVPAQLVALWRGRDDATVQLEGYLMIEMSALIIAFGFTLAFRGYISVPKIYFGSALYVAGLFVMVMRTILA